MQSSCQHRHARRALPGHRQDGPCQQRGVRDVPRDRPGGAVRRAPRPRSHRRTAGPRFLQIDYHTPITLGVSEILFMNLIESIIT